MTDHPDSSDAPGSSQGGASVETSVLCELPAQGPQTKPEPTGPVAPNWPGLLLLSGIILLGLITNTGATLIGLSVVGSIVLHEFGHYITAKRGGIKVTRAFVGMGPTLWSIRRGETEYGIKAFPVGGFVRMIGMHNLDEIEDPADEQRTYRQKSFGRRMLVITAGSLTHFAVALVLLFTILFFHGRADSNPAHWHVDAVTPSSGASAAGLLPGDRIVAVNGTATPTFDDVRVFIKNNAGKTVTLSVVRGQETRDLKALVGDHDNVGVARAFLGVGAQGDTQTVGVVGAVTGSVREFGTESRRMFSALGNLVSPSKIKDYFSNVSQSPSNVKTKSDDPNAIRFTSPVGIGRIAGEAANSGWVYSLALIAAINVSVGIFNLLPLLPLDGGHALIAIYERVRSRKRKRYFADVAKMMPVAYATVFLLVVISLSSLYLDVVDSVR